VKKKLLITALLALPPIALIITLRWGLTPLLVWLGANGELIQTLDSIAQLFIVVISVVGLYIKVWSPGKLTTRRAHEACRRITQRRAEILIDGRDVMDRPDLDREFDEFLSSDNRYCFAIGASGVGKGIAMARQSTRLLERGWTSLLVRGRPFTANAIIDEIAHELHISPNDLSWSKIADLWRSETKGSHGFILMIASLDMTDVEAVDQEFEHLHDAIGAVASERMKVIASCRDSAWVKFHDLSCFALYESFGQAERKSGRRYVEICVTDFSNQELDRALQRISASELITPGQQGADVTAHVATLREMLKHPATFGHYAELYLKGDRSLVHNLTWSGLLSKRIERILTAVRQQSHPSIDLHQQLIQFAVLGQRENSSDFLLDVELVKKELPAIFVRHPAKPLSPFDALIEHGLLSESSIVDVKKVGFRLSDAGAYFLSFDLETKVAGKSPDEIEAAAGVWCETASSFQPLMDAILAWIDRLAENPPDERMLILLKAVAGQYQFRRSTLFNLMNPRVMESVFILAERADDDSYHDYWEAAREIRASPEALAEIRRRLDDPVPRIRRLAAELSGRHRDAESSFDLISLLEDADEDVSHNAYVALGKVGRPASQPLLEIADDSGKPANLRSRCLNALRGIGFRDSKVSEVIQHCLEDGVRTDNDLLQSALLAAAHLRVKAQTAIALQTLTSNDERAVLSAAKYLTEVPDDSAFKLLQRLLQPQPTTEGGFLKRYSLPQQLMAALVSIDRDRAEPIVLAKIREGFNGTGELSPVEAMRTAERTDVVDGRRLLLENFLSQLINKPVSNQLWRSGEVLAATWLPEQLLSLVSTTANSLSQNGDDLSRLLVNAIAPNIPVHDEFPMGDRLNRVKDLLTGAKCEAQNFAPEASRLLSVAKEISSAEICKLLWIVGDNRAEEAILEKLETSPSTGRAAWYERNSIVRALGTCGTDKGAKAVISYLRSEKEISIYFHEQTLYPLLQRQIISTDQIAGLAYDPEVPAGGKIACMLALAELDASAYKDVFLALGNDDDEMIQRYAVRMLGGTEDPSVINFLQDLLRSSTSLSIRAQAAESLAWLDARKALPDIERAAMQNNASNFVGALAQFAESSSLPIVLEGLTKKSSDDRHEFLRAVGSFWNYPNARKAVMDEFDKWRTGGSDWFDNQSSLILGMVHDAPAECLKQFNAAYDGGYVHTSARETMATLIPQLYRNAVVDRQLLQEAIGRLLCDQHVAARERSANVLATLEPAFCRGIYEDLKRSATSERERACGTYMLGFWNSDSAEIERARFDGELLVRRAADAAREMQRLRTAMTWHVQRFSSDNGLARLSSYLCLKEKGQLSSIWQLTDLVRRPLLSRTFINELTTAIIDRVRNDYRKKEEEERRLEESRGTVWFN
jgi:HEAT repeat protein